MFITVEGIEGSGKSTLLSGLAEKFRADGRELFVTREPGGTPLGEAIRRIFLEPGLAVAPLTEALLMNASRAQHVAEAIRPALDGGRVVLCDRYIDSTIAYQGYGRGLDLGFLRRLCEAASSGLLPDLTFVLDVPVDVSRMRVSKRVDYMDRVEAEPDAFHERVRRGFLELARQAPSRYYVLEGERDPKAILEEAYQKLRDRVS